MGSQTDQGLTEPVYTVAEMAAMLRLSTNTTSLRLREGEIKGFKVGRGWRAKKSQFDAYLRRIGAIPSGPAADESPAA